jgi:hemerythrin-like domain-containing protein
MENGRRNFLKAGIAFTATAVPAMVLPGCKPEPEEDVSPAEDLMREHGLLNRILLIYDHCSHHLEKGESFSLIALQDAATVIKTFVEDYHEKLEEDFLFPRFEKANQQTDLVATLRKQHAAGRNITLQIINLAGIKIQTADENKKLINLLSDFNAMYRPHEAREDTILFPAFKKIVSSHEYDSLGEDFEKKEQQLFGKGGFESMVDKVAGIEKQLEIYDLDQFTPVVQ